jgi:hypothetical protein
MRAFILSPNRAYPVTEPYLPASVFREHPPHRMGSSRYDPRPSEAN